MPAKRWLDPEVKIDPIRDQTVAVIGYGIQGRAQASNMKDSGIDVIIGLRKDGKTWRLAQQDGHKVMGLSEAAAGADGHPAGGHPRRQTTPSAAGFRGARFAQANGNVPGRCTARHRAD